MIPYGRQDIRQEDLKAVEQTLLSDYLTQGPVVELFEQKLAEYCGAQYAVACNSATSGLHLTCLALGLSAGDWLWTSPNSFVASANCARYCGAQVDFVDIDAASGNLCIDSLKTKLEIAQAAGCLPKVIVAVHFAGQPLALKKLFELKLQYGFALIEDAAHAIGARYEGVAMGCCRYSDATVFSFHPVKIITAAEGGAVTTNDCELAERIRRLSAHGITRDREAYAVADEGPWSYQQLELGYNFRMSDLHAALGLSQLSRLDSYIDQRNLLAERYSRALVNMPCEPLEQSAGIVNAYHLYVVRLDKDIQRLACFEFMRAHDIGVHVHYIPIYKQPYYRALGFGEDHCPQAEAYYASCLTLPMYAALSTKDQDKVIDILGKALEKSRISVVQES